MGSGLLVAILVLLVFTGSRTLLAGTAGPAGMMIASGIGWYRAERRSRG